MNTPLLFISSNLGGGGAERALLDILNHLDRSQFTPHLALFQREGVFLDQLAADIPVYEIQPDDRGFFRRNWQRARALQGLCEKIQPALVMSVKWQVNQAVLLSLKPWKSNLPIIINEQEPPSASSDPKRRKMWPLVKWVYRWADQTIVITQGIAREFTRDLGIASEKISVIHNPLDLGNLRQRVEDPLPLEVGDRPIILSIGRLAPEKNQPLLLKAFSLILKSRPAALILLGDGPERENLESLALDLGISHDVKFMGFQPNPYPYLAQADIFALTSRYEGFGNVILEALASGVPVVATDCPYGPREILLDGKYGLLVPMDDVQALAEAILDLLDQPKKRARLSRSGRIRAKDFSIETIIPQYEDLFRKVISE